MFFILLRFFLLLLVFQNLFSFSTIIKNFDKSLEIILWCEHYTVITSLNLFILFIF